MITMFEGQVQDPRGFIEALRQYHQSPEQERSDLANLMSDLIIAKRVDLAEVRTILIETGEHELMDSLDRLLDVIEPYIEEGGVEE